MAFYTPVHMPFFASTRTRLRTRAMMPRATTLFPLLLAVALVGCASVPEVESRLRTLRFHPNMYVVQAGDTLETIAFRYELDVGELAALNPALDAQGMLTPGLRINVRPGTRLADAVRVRSSTEPPSAARAEAWQAANDSVPEPASEHAYAGTWQPELREAITSPVPRRTSEGFATSLPPEPVPPSADQIAVAPVDVGYRASSTPRDEELLPDYPDDAANGGTAIVEEDGTGLREEVLPADYDIDGAADRRAGLDDPVQRHVGRWTWPIEGEIARDFAPERIGGQGVDIAGVPGQDVRAAVDGTVVYSGRDLSGEGKLVILRHDDDLMTTYSHANELFVDEEERVIAGDVIASLGWNERRESVLGFEVRRDGDPLDPLAFLPRR